MFPLFFIVLWAAALIGWIANIVQIIGLLTSPITAMLIIKLVGIFAVPLGAILGWYGFFKGLYGTN